MFDTMWTLDAFDDAFFSAFDGGWNSRGPVNLRRESDRYVLEADLPGYDPQSIDVTVDGQWLTIRADRSTDSKRDNAQWIVRERSAESMVRQFAVSQDVDAEAIAADYRDGVLHVVLPIREEVRRRKIDVAVGGAHQAAIGSGATGHQPGEEKTRREAGERGESRASALRRALTRWVDSSRSSGPREGMRGNVPIHMTGRHAS